MKHNLGYFGKIVVTLQNISAGCAELEYENIKII